MVKVNRVSKTSFVKSKKNRKKSFYILKDLISDVFLLNRETS